MHVRAPPSRPRSLAGRPAPVIARRGLPVLSKYKPREKISRVVGSSISACAVVVCAGTVELPVAGILNRKINVLLRPPGKIQDVPFACRTSVGTAGDWSLSEQEWIGSAADVKKADRSGKARAEVIFGVGLDGI